MSADPLVLVAAEGSSLADSVLIGAHPAEIDSDTGGYRCFVLRMNGSGATRIVEVLHEPIYQTWRSTTGVTYGSSDGGALWVLHGDVWRRERVTAALVRVQALWGFAGRSPEEDHLFTTSNDQLFIREAGTWRAHALPRAIRVVKSMHGLRPDEVYVATDDGLYRWDGATVAAVESPAHDVMRAWVVSDDEMIVTAHGDGLLRWTTSGGWHAVRMPAGMGPTIGLDTFQGQVYVGARGDPNGGVVRLDGDTATLAIESADPYCNLLCEVGDHLFARGRGALLFDGTTWTSFVLPSWEAGVPYS